MLHDMVWKQITEVFLCFVHNDYMMIHFNVIKDLWSNWKLKRIRMKLDEIQCIFLNSNSIQIMIYWLSFQFILKSASKLKPQHVLTYCCICHHNAKPFWFSKILKLYVTLCNLNYYKNGFNQRKCIFRKTHLNNDSTNNQQIQNRKRSNRQQLSEAEQMSTSTGYPNGILLKTEIIWKYIRIDLEFGVWSNINEA